MLGTTMAGTLGLTGAEFLWGYGTLCAVGAIGVWQEHRRVLGPTAAPRDPLPELGVYRLALMSGGPDRAITAAAAQLFRDGRLQGTGGTLRTAGELAVTAEPLEREVFETVARDPGLSVEQMHDRVREGATMAALSEQMTRSGLLLEAPHARRMRLLWIVPAVLVALGVAGVLTKAVDSGSVVALYALVAAAVMAASRLKRIQPFATARGRRILEHQRRESAPRRRHPVAGESGLMTALYGAGALWLTDPVTAAALRVPREDERIGGGSAGAGCGIGGSGCGSGGGSGCGGGGCGGGGS